MSSTKQLKEFDPEFIFASDTQSFSTGRNKQTANGVMFDCPAKNCTHKVIVWFSNPDAAPAPALMEPLPRWKVSGYGLDDLTLSPSIDVGAPGDKCWHGFVVNGTVTNAD